MVINLLKTLIFVIPFFYFGNDSDIAFSSTLAALVVNICSLGVVIVWMLWRSSKISPYSFMTQPCTIPGINIWKSFTFTLGGILCGANLISRTYKGEEIGTSGKSFLLGVGIPLVLLFLLWTKLSNNYSRRLAEWKRREERELRYIGDSQ